MTGVICFLLEDTGRMTPAIDGVSSPIMRRVDTGEEMTWREAPAGAMWFQTGVTDRRVCGPDGRSLVVKLPDGCLWYVDSVANNCTKPGDRTHRCWVRHGEAPKVTVDKNGLTCDAGSGSILTKNYHGFLRSGVLESC